MRAATECKGHLVRMQDGSVLSTEISSSSGPTPILSMQSCLRCHLLAHCWMRDEIKEGTSKIVNIIGIEQETSFTVDNDIGNASTAGTNNGKTSRHGLDGNKT